MEKQRTIAKPVSLKSKGLHTGLEIELTFQPAPENHGIIFQRIDLPEKPLIHAFAEFVTETSRGSVLTEKNVKVSTVEHVMASLMALGIDNVLITVTGPEAPIMDGSSIFFVKALREAGFVEQNAFRKYFEVKEKIQYAVPEKGIEIAIYPDDHFSVDVMIDYNSRVLGNQYATLSNLDDFESQVAMARTFVFLHELEFLLKNNLIKGGDLDNAIIIVEKEMSQEEIDRLADLFNKPHIKVNHAGILNNIEIHFPNEPARHKLLDIIGDLGLIGMPLRGRVVAKRPGHFANTELAKIIRKMIKEEAKKPSAPVIDLNKKPLMDVQEIQKLLPHRPPFLLVDKIYECTESTVVGVKNVTMNEPFFVGHFPGNPIMPGVLQVEAMAQCGGVLALKQVPDPENYLTYFLKLETVKFKRMVVPGDTIVFRLELVEPIRRGLVHMAGKAFVGDNLVMEADMMALIEKIK
ncbi:MAG: bifunctional UDP-3-O-[3-hydroxymyristoyl] N-acetylglucosamine deacetylase/3-hydroxyacyl-ACP dehydratase [Bacteroidales bacterium]